MLPKEFKSLWTATSAETAYPELIGDLETEVAIIGGGIAGITAAYFLSKKNIKVAVIESARIAAGTSGNTTAKITSLHDLKYAYLKNELGLEKAKIYADSNEWAIREIVNMIIREKIECDFYKSFSCVYSITEEGRQKIKEEFEAAKELGLPASFVDDDVSLPFKISGGIRFENQAYFHPRKFLLKLAQAITAGKNKIFEKSEVLRIDKDKKFNLITEKGIIRADKIIIATNFPFYDRGLFFARMTQTRSYAFAARLKKSVPEGMYIGIDFDLSIRPHRNHSGEWLILGGEDHPVGEGDGADHLHELEKRILRYFDIESFDYKWAAQDSSALDRVPFIGRMPFAKDIFVASGFGEWGMTTGVVSARILSDLINGDKNKWAKLYDPSRVISFMHPARAKQMLSHLFSGLKRYFSFNDGIYDLRAGEGKIVLSGGKKIAAYKDEAGMIHSVSPICTHMGCMVDWNKTEKTWDCPCHGSRFRYDGEVLNGPAVKSLKKIKN